MRLPTVEFVFANGKRHMQRAVAAMAGNGAAGQSNGLPRGALAEDQKHIASGDCISSQPVVAIDRLQPEHAPVEGPRAHHVLGVDRSF